MQTRNVGNMDALRGGGAQVGVARIVVTLFGMSKEDAKKWGVPEEERRHYARLDGAKSNLGPKPGEPHWYKWITVELRPGGEKIGALRPVRLERANTNTSLDIIESIASALASRKKGWHKLSDVLPELPDSLCDYFASDPSHQALRLQKLLDKRGIKFTNQEPEQERLTKHGLLCIKKGKGTQGTFFLLEGHVDNVDGDPVRSHSLRMRTHCEEQGIENIGFLN